MTRCTFRRSVWNDRAVKGLQKQERITTWIVGDRLLGFDFAAQSTLRVVRLDVPAHVNDKAETAAARVGSTLFGRF